MSKSLFILFVLMSHSAYAQVSSGTIIVFNFSKDQTIVAADSLSINHDTGTPNYSYCKIAAFSHQVIFTGVGHAGWWNPTGEGPIQTWDNTELAKDAVHQEHACCVDLNNIAFRWGNAVKSHWDLFNQFDPQRVMNLASTNDWQLTAGVFINTKLTMKIALLAYNANNLSDPIEIKTGDDISNCWPCGQLQGRKICGAGHHLDVAIRFCSERKHGDKIAIRTSLKKFSESTKLAVKIVEMTIDAYGKIPGDVGGKVDAVTVRNDGSITWNSRKSNCPENRD
jgi:hypothetical protein